MPEETHFLTLVFLDIPTALQVRDLQGDDEASRFLADVTARLERIRHQHGGAEVRTVGSTMLSRFAEASAALRAACDMRTVMNTSRVVGVFPQLRIGIHSGEVTVRGRSFYGEAVSRSARLVTLCAPGQILASAVVHELLSEADRLTLRPVDAPTEWVAAFGELYEAIPEGERVENVPEPSVLAQARRTNTRTFEGHQGTGSRRIQLTQMHRKKVDEEPPPEDAVSPVRGGRLCLLRGHAIFIIDSRTPAVSLGREPGNDVVVDVGTASRRHAHVEWRDSGFFLVDHSWNGTYVYDDNGAETLVHNAEFRLRGGGLICPGCPGSHGEADAIRFVETP